MESAIITSIDKYLASHPGATVKLQEYRDWLKSEENRVREQNNEERRLFDEWLHEQDGKWFFVDFNGSSHSFIKFRYEQVSYMHDKKYQYHSLNFYTDEDSVKITKEKRGMNFLWLAQLYPRVNEYAEYTGNWSLKSQNSVMCVKEVPEDYVQRLFNEYNTNIETFLNKTISDVKNDNFCV